MRELLLDAALACYVRKGIGATSFRDIATEAGATPALLHYYFGDRAQLQEAVVAERLLPAITRLREPLMAVGDDVAALVSGFVQGIGDVVAAHPWLPALWVREVLSEGGALREAVVQRVGPMVPRMLAARFAGAQVQGRLNPGLDPRLLVVSLVGLTLFPLAGAPVWRAMFDGAELDYDDLRRHTLALLARGLELEA
jgi:TetR/AcrR family transcriptional regulator